MISYYPRNRIHVKESIIAGSRIFSIGLGLNWSVEVGFHESLRIQITKNALQLGLNPRNQLGILYQRPAAAAYLIKDYVIDLDVKLRGVAGCLCNCSDIGVASSLTERICYAIYGTNEWRRDGDTRVVHEVHNWSLSQYFLTQGGHRCQESGFGE